MKVWITRDWDDKTYEIWNQEPVGWNNKAENYDQGKKNVNVFLGVNFNDFISGGENGIIDGINTKEAKSIFNLPRHLKKKEIVEGTMTFKVKVEK